MSDETFSTGRRLMIGVVTAGGSLSGLATAGWTVVHIGAAPLTWGLGAVGAAAYAALVFKAETLSFRYKKAKTALSAGWDLSAAVLAPPVIALMLAATFGGF